MTERIHENAHSTESLRKALREMTARHERLLRELSIIMQLDEIDDPELEFSEVCRRLVETVALGLSADNCSLMLMDEDREHLALQAACSSAGDRARFFAPGEWAGKRFRLGEGIVGRVAQSGLPVRLDDASNDPRFVEVADAPEARSLMCFPLRIDEVTVGVLNMSHRQPGFFSLETEHILSLVARRSARLVATHTLHRKHQAFAERLQLVSETSGAGVLVFDRDQRVVSANAAVEEKTGIPVGDLTSGKERWLDHVAAGDRMYLMAHRTRVLGMGMVSSCEYEFRTAAGEMRFFEERSSPLTDASGDRSGYVSVIHDITDKRRSEHEKELLKSQLAQSQKTEAIGQLAGGIAHDFNNLLTGILGNLNLALASEDPAEIQAMVRGAESASARAASLVRQLLTLGRLTETHPVPTDAVAIVEEAVAIVRETFDRRISISVEAEPGLKAVYIEPVQVLQVLLNLCVNARDALQGMDPGTEEHEMRIDFSARTVVVTPADCAANPNAVPGEFVRISVHDTGPGMTEEIRSHAFEPFYTTKEPGKGTGLGLSTVRGIVTQYDGWLDVETRLGQGSTFHVYLPATNEPVVSERGDLSGDVPRGTETVLLVDDEDLIRNLASAILHRLGYTVLLAEDGRKGLELFAAERDRIDLVILDVSMPRLSGFEVMDRIRAIDAKAKVIISSGHATERLQGARHAKPDGYLQKPYMLTDVAQAVRRALDTGTGPA